jgi:small subunit ribosomal protein S15
MISKDDKAKAIALTQVSKNDVGSPQAQVSVLTARIKEVTEHLKTNKRPHGTPRSDSDGGATKEAPQIP